MNHLLAFRNLDDFPIATFTVNAGENHLTRPVANDQVLSPVLSKFRTEPTPTELSA